METLNQWFQDGGYMMYPLTLAAFVALIVIVERLFAIRRDQILRPELRIAIDDMESADDAQKCAELSRKTPGPFAQIINLVFENQTLSTSEIAQAIEDQGQYEIRVLERGVGLLETIAGIAPLMGLLGTVLGIITVFDQIQDVGLTDPGAFSGGISEALITTVYGLSIGIIVLISYNLINRRVENYVSQIQHTASQLMYKLKRIGVRVEAEQA